MFGSLRVEFEFEVVVVTVGVEERWRRSEEDGRAPACDVERVDCWPRTTMFRRAVLSSFPRARSYATIENTFLFPKPPPPPAQAEPRLDSEITQSQLDPVLIDHLVRTPASSRPSLHSLINHYLERSGRVLPSQLPYESTPAPCRRVPDTVQDGGVQLLAHVVREGDRANVCVASAFAVQPESTPNTEAQPIIVSCAHTLEKVCL